MCFEFDSMTGSLLWRIVKFQYVLTYWEEPYVEGTLELRLDVVSEAYSKYSERRLNLVLEANILLNLAVDIFQKLFFNFEFVF